MKTIRDEGWFRFHLKGDVLIVALENTDEMPSINYHAMTQMFDAVKEEVRHRELSESGWCILYDFSAVGAYEVTAATALANFFLWARRNGRQKAAHIFPQSRSDGEVSLIKRVVLGLVTKLANADNDHYTADDVKDALRWFREVRADER